MTICTTKHNELYPQITAMCFVWLKYKVTFLNSINWLKYKGNGVVTVRWALNFTYNVEECRSSKGYSGTDASIAAVVYSPLPYGCHLVFLHPHELDKEMILAPTVRHCNVLRTTTVPQATSPTPLPTQSPISSSSSSSSNNSNITISITIDQNFYENNLPICGNHT